MPNGEINVSIIAPENGKQTPLTIIVVFFLFTDAQLNEMALRQNIKSSPSGGLVIAEYRYSSFLKLAPCH